MNVAIIEDEINAYEYLVSVLHKLDPQIHVVQHCESIKSSVNYLQGQPALDLILLDVQLADGISFEIFNYLSIDTPIIFITAYDTYAIDAFKVNSVDYLLKPISMGELQKALDKYGKRYNKYGHEHLDQLLETIKAKEGNKTKHRFLIKKGNHYEYISAQQLAFVLSEDSITFLFTQDGNRYIYNKSIEQLSEELSSECFFQLSRHSIIHVSSIKEIHPYHNQRLLVVLNNNLHRHYQLVVSRSRVTAFKEWVDQ